jgi:hypothetical protein
MVFDRTDPCRATPPVIDRDIRAMLTAPGDDVVLFKIAHWFGR